MDVSTALSAAKSIKGAFLTLTALGLTAYKWPVHNAIDDLPTCHYVIVGAGTAGSVVANRLTEDPSVNVCLMEAGGDPPIETEIVSLFSYLPKTGLDWNLTSADDGFTAQYRTNPYLDLPSGKVLGGSSSIHHFYHVRGDPKDYDDWVTASGDDSWSWENLLPYFIKSERVDDPYILNSKTGRYHGTNGYMGITRENRYQSLKYLQAFGQVGHKVVDDVNAGETLGFTSPMFTIAKNIRQSSVECYLAPIKSRPNLYVVKNIMVNKILFDDNNQATCVQGTTSDGTIVTVYAENEVIISAGAFNTPKLLMLSGIGPRSHLTDMGIEVISDLPVGENLQDHMAVILLHLLEETNETPQASNPYQFPVPTFVGFGAVNKLQTYPDYVTLNLINRNSPAALMQLCSSVFSLHEDICKQMYTAGVNREVLFTVFNACRPKSRGLVRLRSRDPEDAPLIYTGFLSASEDLTTLIASIQDFIRITQSTYFQNVKGETMKFDIPNCNSLTENTIEYWKCYILNMMDTTFHYSSTCPMGTVLDSDLSVRGVTNLRVVDASSMPNIVSGNINAAVVALAEKAADLIKRDNSCTELYNYVI